MITRLREPDPKPPTERTPGRLEGLLQFGRAVRFIWGSDHGLRATGAPTVLDVGGADGLLEAYLPGCERYWSVDVDPRYPWADAVADAHALPFRGGAVDVVVSKQTLPQFADPVGAVREMCRVARRLVVIRQEWPSVNTFGDQWDGRGHDYFGPIGWEGHSRVRIDAPSDIIDPLRLDGGGWEPSYDGTDFVFRRGEHSVS